MDRNVKILKFEGEVVDGGNSIVVRQYKGDIEIPLGLDEMVEITLYAKVGEVSHQVTNKGTVTRTHIVHVKEVSAVK